VGKLVLVGEAGGGDGLDGGEEFDVCGVDTRGAGQRSVRELVVVAIVAELGSAFGAELEVGLVLLIEERILRGKARGEGVWAKAAVVQRARTAGRRRMYGNDSRGADRLSSAGEEQSQATKEQTRRGRRTGC
jgi:hypothetical protein